MTRILNGPNGSVSFVDPNHTESLRELLKHSVTSFETYWKHFELSGLARELVSQDPTKVFASALPTTKTLYAALQDESLRHQRARPFVIDPSSGTTGVPVLKFTSPADDAAESSAVELAFRQMGITSGERCVCLDVGSSQIYLFYMSVLQRLGVRNPVFLKVTSDHEHAVRLLNASDPTLIISIPSVLKRCLKAFKIAAAGVPARRRRLVFIGEPMELPLRNELMAVLGSECFSFYGTTEVGSICIECVTHSGMHVPLDMFIPTLMPWPDEGQCQVGPTLYRGTVCWTSLLMRAQPVIKYSVNDLVEIDVAPCRCGSNWPLLRFDRRVDETFFLYGITFTYEFFLQVIEEAIGESIELEIIVTHDSEAASGRTDTITLRLDEVVRQHSEAIEAAVRAVHPLSELIWSELVSVIIDFSPTSFVDQRKGRRVRRIDVGGSATSS